MPLLRHLLRRLLLAVPTLVGISLVSFALIHLAPGDVTDASPASAGRLLSRRDAEAQRRLFFLDLPLFFNGHPRGLEGRLERLCQELRDPSRARAIDAWVACGTLCLPALVRGEAGCAAVPEARRKHALTALRAQHASFAPASASLEKWSAAALKSSSAKHLAGLVGALGRDEQAVAALVQSGSAALPLLMERLLQADPAQPPTKARRAASRVVLQLAGFGRELETRQSVQERRRILDSWRGWWWQHRRDYQRYGGWQRLHGHVTETRYAKWVARLLTFDFGTSLHDGQPVSAKLARALPVTLLLSGLAMLLAYLLAVPIGMHAAARRGSLGERALTVTLFVLYSLPPFWVAMLLILLFGGVGLFDVFPIHGLSSPHAASLAGFGWFLDRLWHLVLPVFCLTYGSLAVLSRYQRGALLDVLEQDYIRAARARGLSERRVLWGHALPNALLPTITLLGLHFPHLISGSVIIERIFNIPGMGLLTFEAFLQRDYPVIMAVTVLSAALTLLGLILADVLYAVADPRIAVPAGRVPERAPREART